MGAELLRQLTLDPMRDYQRQRVRWKDVVRHRVHDVPRHHTSGPDTGHYSNLARELADLLV